MVRLSLSSACLDATTIPHASGAWCRIFHLMQLCCLPWCPGRPVLCVLRAWLLGVCVSLALLCALPPGLRVPCGLVLWGCALPCSLVCGPAMPALWAGLVRGPCAWASYKPLPYGLFCGLVFRALYEPLKKRALFSPGFFGYVFPGFFRALFSP